MGFYVVLVSSPVAVIKNTLTKAVLERKDVLGSEFQVAVHHSREIKGDKNLKQLVTSHPQSRVESKQYVDASAQSALFAYIIQVSLPRK